jgi:NADH dehydrogenase
MKVDTTNGGLRPRVVVVGGGFGGLAAARALRRAHADVILFDRHNHHLFQPLLYQVATAALSPGNIAAPIRRILSRQRNAQVVLARVTDVDVEARTVSLGEHRYAYDYLILAAGAVTNYFGNEDWADVAPGLKTVTEALDVRSRLLLAFEQAEIEADAAARRAALTFAIVGAGPTGVEMAGALAEIARTTLRRDFRNIDTGAVRVILLDADDQVLPAYPAELSERAAADLRRMGVELMLGTQVTDVDAGGLTVAGGSGRERIEANNVIWAAGVRAAAIGGRLGVETDRLGRVVVGDDLAIPGHPEVFVVGDLAHRIDEATGRPVPGVAQGAIQMGRFAGEVVAAELRALGRGATPPPRGSFSYNDKGSMATIGRNSAVAEVGRLRFGGVLAWLAWALIHVFFLIGFRRRFLVMAEWVWMYVTYGRGVRLITGANRLPRPVRPPPDPRLASLPLDGPGGLGGEVEGEGAHAGQG